MHIFYNHLWFLDSVDEVSLRMKQLILVSTWRLQMLLSLFWCLCEEEGAALRLLSVADWAPVQSSKSSKTCDSFHRIFEKNYILLNKDNYCILRKNSSRRRWLMRRSLCLWQISTQNFLRSCFASFSSSYPSPISRRPCGFASECVFTCAKF